MAAVGRAVGSTAIRRTGTGSAVGRGTTVGRGTADIPNLRGGTVDIPNILGGKRSGSSFVGGFNLNSPGLGGCRGISSRHSGVGFLARAPASQRLFSSSSTSSSSFRNFIKAEWENRKPGQGTFEFCTLMGAFGTGCYILDLAYKSVLKEAKNTSKEYIDGRLEEMETEHKHFRNLATATHQDFVRKSNQAAASVETEMNILRARMLALEEKEFHHRKELLLAAELLQKAGLDAAATKAAESAEEAAESAEG